jgi:flagellar biosynthesis protein FliR
MPSSLSYSNLALSAGTLYAFLLVLARVSGALVFVPLPGIRGAPEPVRAALALGFTLALFGRWPAVDASHVDVATPAGLSPKRRSGLRLESQ